jgi:threonine dehydrogenase-like Zn-dependent dehydrogenase
LVAQVAKAAGARVVVAGIARDASRLALARRLGADRTVDVSTEDLRTVAREGDDGLGFDLAVECAGVLDAAKAALAVVRPGGRYVHGGLLHGTLPLEADDVFFVRELTLYGTRSTTPSSWRTAVRLLGEGAVDVEPLIDATFPLTRWQEGFEAARQRQAIKIVLRPTRGPCGIAGD